MDIVEFNGRKYGWNGRYYCRLWQQSGPSSLHRAIWEHHNGPIPAGHHVHHRDHDRRNNDIANLELLPAGKHSRLHKEHAYFGSEAHLAQLADARVPRLELQCLHCGAGFRGPHGHTKFCSQACYRAARFPVIHETVCAVCEITFQPEQRKQVVCSKRCRMTRNNTKKRERRAAPA
jgi:hypothetical protein